MKQMNLMHQLRILKASKVLIQKIQVLYFVAHPSGEARSTGTPITSANESPMKARSVS